MKTFLVSLSLLIAGAVHADGGTDAGAPDAGQSSYTTQSVYAPQPSAYIALPAGTPGCEIHEADGSITVEFSKVCDVLRRLYGKK